MVAKTFEELVFEDDSNEIRKIQAKVFYPNGYGASIIQGPHTYGGPEGLFELAVCKGTEKEWGICYYTDITSDVEGHLTKAGVTSLLQRIAALPALN